MSTPPDGTLGDWLDAVARRVRRLEAMRGLAIGLGLAAVLTAAGTFGASRLTALAAGPACAGAGALVGLARGALRRGGGRAGRRLLAGQIAERRSPDSRNLVLTAAEIAAGRIAAPPAVEHHVVEAALRLVRVQDLDRLAPRRPAMLGVLAAVAAWSVAVALSQRPSLTREVVQPAETGAPHLASVTVEIVPPPYTGLSARSLRDPARADAIAGSRILVTAAARADEVTLGTTAGTRTMAEASDGTYRAEVLAVADGFLSITPRNAAGSEGARSLIPLTVIADNAPSVRVTEPGHDLLLPEGRGSVAIAIEAADDLGLSSLRLRYTRVTGGGEQFAFTDGEVPVTIARASDRAWTARGALALDGLALEPGDLVLYRAVAADRRPGAPDVESDAFIVQIAAPGALPGDGFAVDDTFDRYAVSQQMVILKTERLLAAQRGMPAGDFAREAALIAADQRQVRAEFVFMMGGELADHGVDPDSLGEEHEAAGEDDLVAGRLVNQGRADLMRAIRSMSRAASRLTDGDAAGALPVEREALTYLQRAFARHRYILRTLGGRERIDDARRLTGALDGLARPARPASEPVPADRLAAMRLVLADLSTLADGGGRQASRGAAAAMAERLLQIDPASPALRAAAEPLTEVARRADGSPTEADVRAAVDRAATLVAAAIGEALPSGAREAPGADLDRLAGALADALRRGGRQQ